MIPEKSESRLRVERYIDQATGKPVIRYMWDNVLIDHVELRGAIVDRFSGLSLIEKDLNNALAWFKKAERIAIDASPPDTTDAYFSASARDVFDDVKAFFVAALAFYAKAFTEANGRKAQLQRDWLKQEFRGVHDYYMAMRNNFAAHSGDLRIEDTSTQVLLIPDGHSYRIKLHTNRIQPDIYFHEIDGRGFAELVEHAIKIVTQRHSDSGDKIGAAVLNEDLKYWLLKASTAQTVNLDNTYKTFHKQKKSRKLLHSIQAVRPKR